MDAQHFWSIRASQELLAAIRGIHRQLRRIGSTMAYELVELVEERREEAEARMDPDSEYAAGYRDALNEVGRELEKLIDSGGRLL